MKRIAIFASGGGSNARKILDYFEDKDHAEVGLIVSNRRNAGVYKHAADFGVSSLYINKAYFLENECILKVLHGEEIDLIVLAGFLWKIPKYLINAYPNKIVNIHPALLPKYGGKGMYGMNVHKAVKAAGDLESGPTIHFVNEHYDEGKHIFQTSCSIDLEDTPEDIARKVLALEHQHYPRIIDELLSN